MVVEQVASHQVFMDGLKSEEMDSNKLVFPQLKEIAAWFVPFKESLVKREKISQVELNTLFVLPMKLNTYNT